MSGEPADFTPALALLPYTDARAGAFERIEKIKS